MAGIVDMFSEVNTTWVEDVKVVMVGMLQYRGKMSSFGKRELFSCAPVHPHVVVLKPAFSREKLNMTIALIVRNNVNIKTRAPSLMISVMLFGSSMTAVYSCLSL